jgi:putative transposase
MGENGDRRYFIGKASSDGPQLITAARYVERNPVRARLVERATDWPWSSARAHANGEPDPVVEGARWPTQEIRATWSDILAEPDEAAEVDAIRRQTYTGRPLGRIGDRL